MARLILHIGQAKTGSTSIQLTLRANAGALLERGFIYPRTTRITHCHHLLLPLIGVTPPSGSATLRMGGNEARARAAAQSEWQDICAECAAHPDATRILSSETLFRDLDAQDDLRTTLATRLKDLGSEIRVLAYVRSPGPHYLSNLQQRLKSSRRIIQPQPSRHVPVLDFYGRLPNTTCEVRPFERPRLAGGDAVRDFLEWVGVADHSTLQLHNEANTSLSAEAMAVLALLGREDAPRTLPERRDSMFRTRVVRHFDRILPDATRPRLTDTLHEAIVRASADLLHLRDRHGIAFADVDYTIAGTRSPEAIPDVTHIEQITAFDRGRAHALEHAARTILENPARAWFFRVRSLLPQIGLPSPRAARR